MLQLDSIEFHRIARIETSVEHHENAHPVRTARLWYEAVEELVLVTVIHVFHGDIIIYDILVGLTQFVLVAHVTNSFLA